MQLANYITDLLYRYDCVIVPDFGGFVTNKIGAKVDVYTHTFYPPTKQISFNKNLQHNDGLLANYIAATEQTSFEKANELIASLVAKWQQQLTTTSVEIASIGILSHNSEQQIIFEPNVKTNFLTQSFGLSPVTSNAIERYKEQVKTFTPVVKEEEEKKRGFVLPTFAKYAAAIAALLTFSVLGYNVIEQQKQEEVIANKQQEIDQKIQQATFVIDTPLPTLNLTVNKASLGNYHIVAGAFKMPENAEKKLLELQAKGFKNARIIDKNKWGLTQVTYTSIADENEALKTLRSIKQSHSKYAWLLVKNLN